MGQGQSGSRYRIQPGGTGLGNTLGSDALREKLEAARVALDEDISGSDAGKHSRGQHEVKQEDRGPAASSAFLTENEAKALIGEDFWDPALYEANMDSNGNVAKADLRAVIQAAVQGDPPVSASTSAVASAAVSTATPSSPPHVSPAAEGGANPAHSADTEEKFDIFAQDDGFAEMVDDDGLDSSDSDSDSDVEKNDVAALLQGGAQEGTATAAAAASIATPSLAANPTETAASTATPVATVTATVTEHVSKFGDLKRLTNVSDELSDTVAAVGGKLSAELQDAGSTKRKSTLSKFRKKAKKAHTVETAFLLKSKDK